MASWKKIIVSGSNAELNHITSSGNFEIAGNVSGSVNSTGSFGRVMLCKNLKSGEFFAMKRLKKADIIKLR